MIDFLKLTGSRVPIHSRWIYFAPPQFKNLSVTHQEQFLFLDEKSTDSVYELANSVDLLCGDDGWGNTPLSGGYYQDASNLEIGSDEGKLKSGYTVEEFPFLMKFCSCRYLKPKALPPS